MLFSDLDIVDYYNFRCAEDFTIFLMPHTYLLESRKKLFKFHKYFSRLAIESLSSINILFMEHLIYNTIDELDSTQTQTQFRKFIIKYLLYALIILKIIDQLLRH